MKEELKGLYFVKVNWYDTYNDKEEIACAFVIATDYASAVKKVAGDYEVINSITIEEVVENGMCHVNAIYVPDDPYLIDKIKETNEI